MMILANTHQRVSNTHWLIMPQCKMQINIIAIFYHYLLLDKYFESKFILHYLPKKFYRIGLQTGVIF